MHFATQERLEAFIAQVKLLSYEANRQRSLACMDSRGEGLFSWGLPLRINEVPLKIRISNSDPKWGRGSGKRN